MRPRFKSVIRIPVIMIITGLLVLYSFSIMINGNHIFAKYENTQTQSLLNDCQAGNAGSASNCAITSPQTQADGVASTPTNLQISDIGIQGPQGDRDPEGMPEDVQSLEVRQQPGNLVTVAPNTAGNSTATCSSDEEATGGGSAWTSSGNAPPNLGVSTFVEEGPPDSYVIGVDNNGQESVLIQALAECAKLVQAS